MTDIQVSFRVKSEVYFIFWADKKIVTFYRKRQSQYKQTEKQRSTLSRSAFIYTFNFTTSVYLNTRTSSRHVMGLLRANMAESILEGDGCRYHLTNPGSVRQELFTQTAIAVSINREQERSYVREVNRVW